ncbi:TJAP1 family protein [Megaselia abdita]
MSTTSEMNDDSNVDLHAEVDALKQALMDKQNELIAMETACFRESDRQVELEDSIIAWQDKYDRLYESHKRIQKVNQNLEDKLLKLVDRNSGERAQLTSDVAALSVRLAQANYNIAKLQREIERYKTDINLAIQLLQCKPDSFLPQKVSSLPVEIQSKVSAYMRLETNSDSEEGSTSGVGPVATSGSYKVLPASDSPPPSCPFPPTAMVYSMRGLDNTTNISINNSDMISPSTMVKFLEDELKKNDLRHCDTCRCSIKDLTVLADISKSYTVSTQTAEANQLMCLRCNTNLNSPPVANSPYLMKLGKSSDSIISGTKSSCSDGLNDTDKLFTPPAKKDDLMVNPILGHHRLCDRTNSKLETAKYLMETNRKFIDDISGAGDLIDLRKYSNATEKSPLLTSSSVKTSASARVPHLLNSSSSDCRKMFSSSTGDGNANVESNLNSKQSSQNSFLDGGDGFNSTTDSKLTSEDNCSSDMNVKLISSEDEKEKKVQITPGRSESIGTVDKITPTDLRSSANSLWSKSDSEGAKMFETFNRNLIKAIMAENPKHKGPRLCALRIQNGSSNILLDNMESNTPTPIMYTRRERFLDEELDDNKDIITSSSTIKFSPILPTCNILDSISVKDDDTHCIKNIDENMSKTDSEKLREIAAADKQQQQQLQQNQQPQLQSLECDRKLTNSFLEQQYKNFVTSEQHQQLLKASFNYDILNFNESLCKNSMNSKSCTQSSSTSEAIDFEETALLRRQQLNRVAEWVENNSKIEEREQNLKNLTLGLQDVNANNQQTLNGIISGHIKQTLPNGVRLLSSNFKRTPYHHNKSSTEPNYITSDISIAQNNVILKDLPSEYVNGEEMKKHEIISEKEDIDLAQMEYNVKQFLLKQNEWSIRSSSNFLSSGATAGATGSTTSNATVNQKLVSQSLINFNNNSKVNSSYNSNEYENDDRTSKQSSTEDHMIDLDIDLNGLITSQPQRTETHL